MFEVTIVEIAKTGFDMFVSLAPIFVSLAVFVVAALQWKTSSTAVAISEAVAEVGRQQLEANQTALKIAHWKRNDDLFDRRLVAFRAWALLVGVARSTRTLRRVDLAAYTENRGMDSRYLFDKHLALDIRSTFKLARTGFEEDADKTELTAAECQSFLDAVKSRALLGKMIIHLEVFDQSDDRTPYEGLELDANLTI